MQLMPLDTAHAHKGETMNKKLIIIIVTILLIVIGLCSAVTFSPQGNIDLKNLYNITNWANLIITGNIEGNGTENISGFNNISGTYLDGNSTWEHQSYPAACSANYAVTALGDSVTCTDSWVNIEGDDMTGNLGINGMVDIEDIATIHSYNLLSISLDANAMKDTSVIDIFADVSGADDIKNYVHSVYDTKIDAGDSGEGTLFVLDVTKSGSEDFEASAVGVHKDIAVAFQIIGDFENVSAGWKYNSSYTNATSAFQDTGVNITVAENDDDYMYIGSSSWFTEVELNFARTASASVTPIFEYHNGTDWDEFRPSDKTDGFTEDGLLTFNAFVLGGWGTNSVNGVDAYWIRIQRTEDNLTTTPIIEQIKVLGSGLELYYWDKLGNLAIKSSYSQEHDIVKDLSDDTEPYVALDVSMTNKGSLHTDVIKITGDFDHVIHCGSEDIMNKTYYDNLVSISDITDNMTNSSNSNVVFNEIDGALYICSDDQFDRIGFILETISSHNIEAELYYCNATTEWKQESIYSDSSNGLQRNGMYSWDTPADQTTCNVSMNGTAFSDVSPYYCVALKRKASPLPTPPAIQELSIAGSTPLLLMSYTDFKTVPTDSPITCNANNLGNEYFDISEDFKCLCISTGYVRMDDGTACT